MKTISKQELLKMIDDQLPDDAQISASSMMAGEAFTIDTEVIASLLPSLADMEETCGAEEIVLPGSTHVLYVS